VRFEWDRGKAEGNLEKHAVSFEEAITIFYEPLATSFPDPEHSLEESRFITFGYSTRGRLLVVSHTDRGDAVRVISARVATPKERKRYESHSPNRQR
jgi:uncharacterized protein